MAHGPGAEVCDPRASDDPRPALPRARVAEGSQDGPGISQGQAPRRVIHSGGSVEKGAQSSFLYLMSMPGLRHVSPLLGGVEGSCLRCPGRRWELG